MEIKVDNLTSPKIADFLSKHIDDMKTHSPPGSKHALDLEGLKCPKVTFWSMWDGESIIACGALKELTRDHAELKSMRTAEEARRVGIASELLTFILCEAIQRNYSKVSLETGTMSFFEPAQRLYKKFGFEVCPPFADYTEDQNSIFMSKQLSNVN